MGFLKWRRAFPITLFQEGCNYWLYQSSLCDFAIDFDQWKDRNLHLIQFDLRKLLKLYI